MRTRNKALIVGIIIIAAVVGIITTLLFGNGGGCNRQLYMEVHNGSAYLNASAYANAPYNLYEYFRSNISVNYTSAYFTCSQAFMNYPSNTLELTLRLYYNGSDNITGKIPLRS